MCPLLKARGSLSQICCISGHWMTEAKAENNDLLHRPMPRKILSSSFLLLFSLLRPWWFCCCCCFTIVLLSLGEPWFCTLKVCLSLVGAYCKRQPMNVCFKALDNLSPVRTVPFIRPYIKTLQNPIFWHNGCERSALWETSFIRLQVLVKFYLPMLLSFEVES